MAKADALRRALESVLACCQEVAHEVEDPTQACAEIEQISRKALAGVDLEEESDA